jgi:LppX/LprAFG-like lipoprotein
MRRALVVLAAAPLLLAACGGGSSSSQVNLTPTAYVLQAAKKSAQATSEHVEMAASMTALGQSVTMTGDGDFDSVKHVGSMTVHAGLQGIDMQIDEVQDGTTIYMKSPLLQAALPQGKTWVKIDLEQVGKSKGFDFSQLMGQDPSQSFSQLEATGQVTKVGDETIDGAETTHYRGHIDTAKLPPAFAKLAAKYGAYDVWIGKDDGYVHRMQTSYSVAKQSVSMTMNFSDFGKDVTVDVPAAADTVDATSKSIKGLGG